MAANDFKSLPAAAAGLAPASAASAWGYGTYVEIISAASNTTGLTLYGLSFQVTNVPALDTTHQLIFDIATGGSGSEAVKVQVPYSFRNDTQVGYYITNTGSVFFPEPVTISSGTRLAIRAADTLTSAITYNGVKLRYQEPVNNQAVTTASPTTLTLSTFAVTATIGTSVTPGVASLTLSQFAPTVTATNNKSITTAAPLAVTTTLFAPTVVATNNIAVTPDIASLSTTLFTPSVTLTNNVSVSPGTASLTTSLFSPTVAATDNKEVTPGTLSATLSTFAPVVAATANVSVTPSTATLTLTPNPPAVSLAIYVEPATAQLTLTTFAPTVDVPTNVVVTPGVATLSLTTFRPTVQNSGATKSYFIDVQGNEHWIIDKTDYYIDSEGDVLWILNRELGLVEKV